MLAQRTVVVAICATVVAICLGNPSAGKAGVVSPVPTVSQFGVYRDNGDRTFSSQNDALVGCVTNMMSYVCAAQTQNYKQYDNPKGYDISSWPSSGDGRLYWEKTGTHVSDVTWLTPQDNPGAVTGTINVGGTNYSAYSWMPNVLQFYLNWAQLDHNTDNPDYANVSKGYSLGINMNQEQRYWDPVSQTVKHVIAGLSSDTSTNHNNVKIDFTVVSAVEEARMVLSDDFSTDPADYLHNPFYNGEQPSGQTATSELKKTGVNTFSGDWNYKFNSSDGGVIGNLMGDGSTPLIIRVDLVELGDLDQIIFYDFLHGAGNYDPFDMDSYDQPYTRLDLDALGLGEGDSFFITLYDGCCNQVPEPMTLGLLLLGGAGLMTRRRVVRRARARADR